MGSVLLTGFILVILSTCYTNGLELTDLYPYGTEHGDTMRTGYNSLPTVPLLAPIDNLVAFGPTGLTATRYTVNYDEYLRLHNDGSDSILLNLLYLGDGDFDNTKIYGRTSDDPALIKRSVYAAVPLKLLQIPSELGYLVFSTK
ncbi:PREDICTED: uncharacterized protein LOC109588117 [Amphimedon queenslandica]|uniref:Uncharacterized protein n=2 Tax=Amphimedon queenslandica TaxID=400682 RepID=A0AAN0JSR6_AMPQE|nr:PREDICTED: uncharacterized protein LOC109588117 [Amphimedon queenslandica]|eukprot:XP_019859863.1 PREDICTED: uncharacterized protein LOC109588117 [Amphimedon queenslandica]